MAQHNLILECKVSRWVKWYIKSVVVFCYLFNTIPNFDKVLAIAKKGIKVNIKK